MASFAPHPPGYPVYVACLRVAAVVASSPLHGGAYRRVRLRASVTFAVLVASPSRCLRRAPCSTTSSPPLRRCRLSLTPLAFHAFSSVGSEGPALRLRVARAGRRRDSQTPVVSATQLLSPRRRSASAWVSAYRLSWALFYVPFLFLLAGRSLLRASFVALRCRVRRLGRAATRCPPDTSRLVVLYRTQAGGHFERWGGIALTEPAIRARFLARDVLADGFGAGRSPRRSRSWSRSRSPRSPRLSVWRKRDAVARIVRSRRGPVGVLARRAATSRGSHVGRTFASSRVTCCRYVFVAAFALASAALVAGRAVRPALRRARAPRRHAYLARRHRSQGLAPRGRAAPRLRPRSRTARDDRPLRRCERSLPRRDGVASTHPRRRDARGRSSRRHPPRRRSRPALCHERVSSAR